MSSGVRNTSDASMAGPWPVRTEDRPIRAGLRVAILSRKRSLYSTKRLIEAIRAFGNEALVFDTLRCELVVERDRRAVLYEGEPMPPVDLVIPRIGASITNYGLAVVNQLQLMGIPVLNPAEGIGRSRDKLRCLQLLADSGIDVPRTAMMRRRGHLARAVERIGGLPVIVKLLRGTQGVGVMLAHSMEELESALDTLWNLDQEILLQEFIAESRGRDIRAVVVGDRVVGAMRRIARTKGEFRSNLHRGGKGEAVELPPAYEREAVRAAKVVGLSVAGVDMLESREGPKVAEVNSSPGLQGIERALRIDVAGAIVAHGLHLALGSEHWFREAVQK